ncbi:MAG: ferrous iron transport protein B, partial [Anaerolineales bacterium]
STLFNQVAGYKAETGNFHGTTVTYTESRFRLGGKVVEIVDLPGLYTLEAGSPAEQEVRRYLESHKIDAIINIVDALRLSAGLELTLELLQLGHPLVLAINMMDEAAARGLEIDFASLSGILGVPVLPLVASKGRGVRELLLETLRMAEMHKIPTPSFDLAVGHPMGSGHSFSEPDEMMMELDLEQRHRLAREIGVQVSHWGIRRVTLGDRLDRWLLHPIAGYFFLLLVLWGFFQATYAVGKVLEVPLLAFFAQVSNLLQAWLGADRLLFQLVDGIVQGVAAGAAIVLPYLVPFLLGLGLLEDIGYLPRVAFLMDGFLHRLGLHGKAIIPFILGYGCNVPAVMSTRILENERDRLVTAALSVLVPCAARIIVVFGLVAFYLGPLAALSLYLLNILVIALTGLFLMRLLPESTPGLILEMPPFRIPTWRVVGSKIWFRVRSFITEAWPLLIFGSLALTLLQIFAADAWLNMLIRPVTWMLGLPVATGVPLIFGILRKELSLVMLGQALGSNQFDRVLLPHQMLTFATFVMFYVPCLATLAVLRRELGTKNMFRVAALTVFIAVFVALLVRLLSTFLL